MMVDLGSCGREGWWGSCEGVGGCKSTGVREEISGSSQEKSRYIWV